MSIHNTSANIYFLTVLALAGCGSDKGDVTKDRLKAMSGGELKTVVPVSGKVLVNGEPVEGVMLELWSDVKSDRPIRKVIAGKDGKYCWSRYTRCDGLEPGAYKLTFKHLKNPKKENSEDLFKGRLGNVGKSKHEIIVETGKPQENVDYDLSTK